MALTVETGTGVAGAESYASVAEADARNLALGNASWTALTVTDKEVALRKATNFMVMSYRTRWNGYRSFTTQLLDWPRTLAKKPDYISDVANYYLPTDMPIEIKNACIDLAFKTSTGIDLSPDIDRITKREKVGPIEVEYATGSVPATTFRAVEGALRPFFKGGGVMTTLVRT